MARTVATVVGMVAEGMTNDEILADHPDLEADDIPQALEYAAEAVANDPWSWPDWAYAEPDETFGNRSSVHSRSAALRTASSACSNATFSPKTSWSRTVS